MEGYLKSSLAASISYILIRHSMKDRTARSTFILSIHFSYSLHGFNSTQGLATVSAFLMHQVGKLDFKIDLKTNRKGFRRANCSWCDK